MQMAISAQKPPARNALIVGVSCVNPTWKPVADATRFSVRVAFSSIERFEACAPGTSGEKKRLARQRLPKQNTSVFTSGSRRWPWCRRDGYPCQTCLPQAQCTVSVGPCLV